MARRYHRYVHVIIPFKLFGWQDDLNTLCIVRFWDWMIHYDDRSNNKVTGLEHFIGRVGWIANDERSRGRLITALDSCDFASVIEEDFITVGVEHVGAAVDGTQS